MTADYPGKCDPRPAFAFVFLLATALMAFVGWLVSPPHVAFISKCPRQIDSYYLDAMRVDPHGAEYECRYSKRGVR